MKEIIFETKVGKLTYEVRISGNGYFLNISNQLNSYIFEILGMDYKSQENFTKKVLGYCSGGGFPYCKTKDDLYKLAEEIKKLLNPEISLLCL